MCASNTYAVAVAESMGNYVDLYSDIATVGDQSYIHWNCPPLNLSEELGKTAFKIAIQLLIHWRESR